MKNKTEEYQMLATNINQSVGGEKNIDSVIHCVTCLRFYLKDDTKGNEQEIKAVEGAIGAGKNTMNSVFNE